MKCLDIGPGSKPIREKGWESLDLYPGYNPTYVADCRHTGLPDNTFDIVHSSHVIEHVEWHQVEETIREWARIVRPGGRLEVWTVNAALVMQKMLDWEQSGVWPKPQASTWKANLTQQDPYKYMVGKLLNYCREKQNKDLNLHRAILTPRYLRHCLEQAGLTEIRMMDPDTEVRSHRHGWINMGVCGTKC